MDGGPVYFIGGTFGGSGGWTGVFTLAGALIGAVASLFAVVAREKYARFLDRRSLAAALLSEITSIMRVFEDYKYVELYEQVQEILQRAAESGIVAPGNRAEPTFRTTVYERCADRIGMLGTDEAAAVVRFYGFLNGVRNTVNRAYDASLSMQDRISTLEFLNRQLFPNELHRAKALQHKLERVVNQPWRLWE
jgi:hypothetical protein